MHEVLLNVGPMPSSNASTSENVRPVAFISAWVQFPLLRPSNPVGASVTALTCGPGTGSSAWVATATFGSSDGSGGWISLDGDEHANSKDAGMRNGSLYSWRCAFMIVLLGLR